MGDRTPIEVIVYSCPPERVSAVLEVLEEFGLGPEFVRPDDPTPRPVGTSRQLELCRGYIHSEISVGSSAEIAAALPCEAAWKVWGPKYEHLGEVHLNHPDLGVFVADCDAQGHPVFTSETIDRLVERTAADRVQLGHLTGRTWEAALAQLAAANEGVVIPSDVRHGSAPLQAVALNQLAAGPSRWMPADAPGQARSTTVPDP